jgi:hypothetical protein
MVRVEVKRPRETGNLDLYIMVGTLFVVALYLFFEVTSGAEKNLLMILRVAVIVMVIVAAVLALLTDKLRGRKLEKLSGEIQVTEENIYLPMEVPYEVGKYTARAVVVSSRWTRNYRVAARFRKESKDSGSTIPLPSGPFSVSVKRNDEGFLSAPAVRLKGKYSGIVILVFEPWGKVVGEGSLSAQYGEDSATATFESNGDHLEGKLSASVSRARNARLEVFLQGYSGNSVIVAEGEDSSFSFNPFVRMPNEKIAVLTTMGFSPRDFKEIFGPGKYVAGHGKYGIKLVLDIPHHRDVVEKGYFEVVHDVKYIPRESKRGYFEESNVNEEDIWRM